MSAAATREEAARQTLVRLPAGSLLIGDLHLDVGLDPETSGVLALENWLERARGAPALVVLGDLFEYWLGPAQERSAGGRRVLDALARLARTGCAIELLLGNRDFLLTREAAARAGARLHPEGFVAELEGGRRALVLHGDTLCTLDSGYQRLRRVLRSSPVRALGPRVPAPLGHWIARRLRRASEKAVGGKRAEELSIQPSAAVEAARASDCELVVCGHAHRFRDELLAGGVRLCVVDAFGGARDTLVVEADGQLAPRPRGA